MVKNMAHRYKAIMFDFDGVICESNEVKTEAFRMLFAEFPECLNQIIDYHRINGGLSRFKKFEFIYREILRKKLDKKESEKLGERFSKYVYQRVLESPFVSGAYDFLERNHKRFSLFVISGTPQDEIVSIVNERKLNRFFRGVYGSPATKSQMIQRILKEENWTPGDVVFVGDSVNDYEETRAAGVRMVGRIQNDDNLFGALAVEAIIRDMNDLEAVLNSPNTEFA